MLSIADLDAFFSRTTPRTTPKAKTPPKAPPVPPSPTYWRPEAVVLWIHQWTCTCGSTGPGEPQLMLRERHGRSCRLLSIRSPAQYSLLPREIEYAEPSQVHICPHCFSGITESLAAQVSLPFPEPEHEFRRAVQEAVDFTVLLDELSAVLEHHELPKKVRSIETPLPENYEFIPLDDEWKESQYGGRTTTIYHHSVSSDAGPCLPHSWKETF